MTSEVEDLVSVFPTDVEEISEVRLERKGGKIPWKQKPR